MLTKEYLIEHFSYKDGILYHKPKKEITGYDRRFNRLNAGKEAGTLHHTGYKILRVFGKHIGVHRLVFMYHHGYMPDVIDHLNQDRSDNRIENLVASDVVSNGRNRRLNKNNTSGAAGVIAPKGYRKKWRAQIKIKGKQICLGWFEDKFEAICARKSAEKKNSFSERHGFNG